MHGAILKETLSVRKCFNEEVIFLRDCVKEYLAEGGCPVNNLIRDGVIWRGWLYRL